MYWTEAHIAEHLGASFFRMEVREDGRHVVVDLNEAVQPEPPTEPIEWTNDRLISLVVMKRKLWSNMEIAQALAVTFEDVSYKWSKREDWIRTIEIPHEKNLKLADIGGAVCAVFNIGENEFYSQRRFMAIVDARKVFYWIARNYTRMSFPQIGAAVNKDHSTVVHGAECVDAQYDKYRRKIGEVLSILGLTERVRAA